MIIALRVTCSLTAMVLCVSAIQIAVYGASNQATPFVPGQISSTAESSAAPAFSPDGKAVYFGRAGANEDISIVVSQKHSGKWSDPVPATFSGQYRDLEPAFAPNGKYLIFASNRPATKGGPLLEGHYNGETLPGKGGNLWQVQMTKNGWSAPERLPENINSNSSVFSPAITGDGSLYFMRADDGIKFHLFRAQSEKDGYQAPKPVSFASNNNYADYDPVVAPDESFVIFSSGRPPAPHRTDLFVTFRTANGWGPLIDLSSELSDQVYGVEARLSPDRKTLYYTNSEKLPGSSSVKRAIWMINIDELLKKYRVWHS